MANRPMSRTGIVVWIVFASTVLLGPVVIIGWKIVEALSSVDETTSAPTASPCATGTEAAQRTPINPAAAPYAGVGPHPAAVIGSEPPNLPTEWTAAEDDGRLQLIVCQQLIATGAAEPTTCDYGPAYPLPGSGDSESEPDVAGESEPISLTIVEATYTYEVFEARTARPVTTVTLQGSESSCPGTVGSWASSETVLPKKVSDAELTGALRPVITEPAP
ncbi:hypothetical protein [Saccharopolyspora sp. 5N708]|uniref:hypothetical protein n=1 Tax=Saccharopolyspora sp. 5N708 TaxID=3457424 RepID=UPI003FD0D08E